MQYVLVFAIPVVLITCWIYTAHVARASFPQLREKRICLLIAHPDDEAMFFAPSVLALTDPKLGNHLKILCLSSGNADGLGETRKRELIQSATLLGLRSFSDVFIVEDPAFPDSMTTKWDTSKIIDVLSSAFSGKPVKAPMKKQAGANTGQDEAPTASIDVLITFDRQGVSGHANHISLYHGAVAWLKHIVKGKTGWDCPVALYTLTSTNIVRKYISVLDAPFTMLRCVLQSMQHAGSKERESLPRRLMYLSDLGAYRTAQKAMTRAHKSQMRWFRWGWIGVGRFMVVNDLKREKI